MEFFFVYVMQVLTRREETRMQGIRMLIFSQILKASARKGCNRNNKVSYGKNKISGHFFLHVILRLLCMYVLSELLTCELTLYCFSYLKCFPIQHNNRMRERQVLTCHITKNGSKSYLREQENLAILQKIQDHDFHTFFPIHCASQQVTSVFYSSKAAGIKNRNSEQKPSSARDFKISQKYSELLLKVFCPHQTF